MSLIDTHCHIYLQEFDKNLTELIFRCKLNGVEQIFLPAIDSETHERVISLSKSQPGIYPMMGLHPCSVKSNFEDELRIVEQNLSAKIKYYAIGEIGLDYHWDLSFKKEQQIAFHKQIEIAIAKNLPIVIHSRKSTQDCIDIVSQYKGNVSGIFHCFGGTIEEAMQIIELGFYLGIGGVVTYKNSGLKEVLHKLSLENIVLETDSPYLTPVPHRGKQNEPSFLKIIAEHVATATNTTLSEVARITSQNALKVFKMN